MNSKDKIVMYRAGRCEGCLTALYEEDTLCELNLEPKKSQVRVGDIYIGKVKHIAQNSTFRQPLWRLHRG